MSFIFPWIESHLKDWGVNPVLTALWSSLILLLLLVASAIALNYLSRAILKGFLSRFSAHAKRNWLEVFTKKKILIRLTGIIPAIFLYATMPLAFPNGNEDDILKWLRRLCIVYIIAVVVRFIYASMDLIDTVVLSVQSSRNKTALKGLVQILQIAALFVGAILIISTLIDRSPTALFAGLGASAAILMLVFKDLILGFVAGLRLSGEDTLRVGDWITVPKYGADGDVVEVSLGAVKVRNFDNTIVTIPPYALVSESFQNWRGMSESGGRRIKRAVYIDMSSVKFCTPQMLERYSKISLLKDYVESTERNLRAYNTEREIDDSVLVNGRRQTNLGVFRAYLERYLKNNPRIHQGMTCMVRQLQPTELGIPLELYCFTADTRWVEYENIQSDIFDHIIASIPEFNLAVFQSLSGQDLRGRQT